MKRAHLKTLGTGQTVPKTGKKRSEPGGQSQQTGQSKSKVNEPAQSTPKVNNRRGKERWLGRHVAQYEWSNR